MTRTNLNPLVGQVKQILNDHELTLDEKFIVLHQERHRLTPKADIAADEINQEIVEAYGLHQSDIYELFKVARQEICREWQIGQGEVLKCALI